MKMKWICSVLLVSLTAAVLTGCGDGSGGETQVAQEVVETVEATAEPVLSKEEKIADYEARYSAGEFGREDYHALAELYKEVGLIRKQRDMLEESYFLFDDADALEKLQSIAVNIAEEEQEIQKEAQTILQNLELPEYVDESINMIYNEKWFATMMPKLDKGKRTYYLQQNDRNVLTIQAGYDEAGVAYSNVWYLGEDAAVTLLQYSDNAIQMLNTQLVDGKYDGNFESWLLDGKSSTIYQEQGTFTKGIYTGEYTARVHAGTVESDLFALWSNREGMEYVTYTGAFDEQGKTTLKQPAEENMGVLIEGTDYAACVVYAYDAKEKNCLFLGLEEGVDVADYSFEAAAMGFEQYFELGASEEQAARGMSNRGMGAISIATPTLTPTKKPATNKPASTPAPVIMPTPIPAPPREENTNDENHNDGGSSDNNNAGNGGSTDNGDNSNTEGDNSNVGGSENSGNTDGNGDSGNGDVDIEWTDDIL